MTIAEMLLTDFDTEAVSTRRVLERMPEDRADWKPHEKSTAAKTLALHVATLPFFGLSIVTSDELNMATSPLMKHPFESFEKTVELAAGAGAELRAALAHATDEFMQAEWTLSYGDQVIAKLPRLLAYRTMFFNHLVHHRGQLTVYLRLMDVAVPGIYGPSADEPWQG